ncbi:hypothetical protein J7E97_19070 [Streptomyces sp. ISL-66]|uniref:hypothetical protein n=1 Tax=Streptomyces sp. ISL-66 TaxID=2819186 RepID=UPI001BE7DDEE|nr:hypothetical protein [Streptomyces sp. ISL-66]MBT2469922.1 hypothetical protein [Streptomyces sp. ISL-66]
MSREHSALDGLLGLGRDAEGREFYLRVAAGELTYDRGAEVTDYIQVYLFQTATPARPADANDMFETDGLDELAAELRNGMLDWYGERLEFRTPTPEERELIRSATGWT